MLALAGGCALKPTEPSEPAAYIALLPDADGGVGKVVVQELRSGQQTQLDKPLQAVKLDGSGAVFRISPVQLHRDFGDVFKNQPVAPASFLLYFKTGGAELNAESVALLPQIVEQIKARAGVDVSIIGHTDTQGKADANTALALRRAEAVEALLKSQGMQAGAVLVESHGESNLLVPTPDETPEPRNRRVEIVIR
jgi:outer membrane protein OmpA-like peptidoglycan-associated protein